MTGTKDVLYLKFMDIILQLIHGLECYHSNKDLYNVVYQGHTSYPLLTSHRGELNTGLGFH